MRIIKVVFLFVFSLAASLLHSQQEAITQSQDTPASAAAQRSVRLRDFEPLVLNAIRQQFPRFPGVLASVQTCRLPDYGPLITVTIQPPLAYFTRPVMQELEKRSRYAEEQARKIRVQIDRAAQLITLRAKEADLVQRIQSDRSGRRKKDDGSLDKDLSEVRRSLSQLQSDQEDFVTIRSIDESEAITEVDLNRMMAASYQDLIAKVGEALKNCLAENAPAVENLTAGDRISIAAHVRDNFLGNQDKHIVFVLNASDIQAFRSGGLKVSDLKKRIVVKELAQE